jgi:hypothetical protein
MAKFPLVFPFSFKENIPIYIIKSPGKFIYVIKKPNQEFKLIKNE